MKIMKDSFSTQKFVGCPGEICFSELNRSTGSIRHQDLAAKLTDPEWLVKLAYLSDIFNRLNELNKLLQGSHKTLCINFEHSS